MLKSLQLEPEKCTGCLQCEMACSYENEGVFNPAKSRIKVFNFHDEGRFAPYTCTQCTEAWCLHACPVEAIVVNESTGAKEVIEEAKKIAAKESILIQASQKPGFNLDRLREAWKGMDEIH